MTGKAAKFRMCAVNPEVSLRIVVEGPYAPVIRRVAVGALVTQIPLVHVIRPVAIDTAGRCAVEFSVDMTRLTGSRCVQTGQRKGTQVMVETDIRPPGLHAVAITTACTERLLVHVVSAMTGHTGHVEPVLFHRTLVAGYATGFGMGTEQRKLRFPGVIEAGLIPCPGRVTGLALGPVAPLVRIVTAMAVDTGLAGGLPEIVPGMTGLAGKAFMAGRQGEAGLLRMIEGLLFPCSRPMAVFAGRTALSLVRVVDPVTRHAGRGCVFVAMSGMTQAAFNLFMGARQRVTLIGGFRMIESGFLPRHGAVATGAILAEGFLVDVLFRMTTDAGRWRIAMLFLWPVAVAAGRVPVCTLERVIGQGVIKGLRRQAHDIRVAALVVGMAVPALALPRRAGSPVKALLAEDVGGNLVVTVQAQGTLFITREGHMALAAVFFDFGMTADHRARHDETFPVQGAGNNRHQHADQ